MQRSAQTRGAKVPLLIDNISVLGALGKGRSSSRALNSLCRRLAAETILCDVALILYPVPSHLNLANAPSRSVKMRVPRGTSSLAPTRRIAIIVLRKADKKENTVRDYKGATLRFAHWLEEHYPSCKSVTEFDRHLAEYGCQLFTANPKRGQHQKFLYTIYGIRNSIP